ncbi:MAG: IS66 family transposase [Hyphomonas sp.]|uniref:IS66 family transposase n=1 Tax=Hyphomonas sp. TaxID=87 RepID=UPI00178DDF41|nr:IS66 family transposase [Hyphomonas sp.]MBA3067003.1 IS66 family transposase [Hyphomonas sp.]MBU3921159.1 IS66 family transposase [Alphaproteobacteria bacterium]MBU4062296.1 IS66 family transposase [Alphaproteobacteria bacterium]MBU4163197.1 IS66 family transposase [Alphaproteobacteria bacterium]
MPETLTAAELAELPPKVQAVLAAQAGLIAAHEQKTAAAEEKVAAIADEIGEIKARNERLEYLVKELRRALYGKKSERLDPDQLDLLLEDLETAVAKAEEESAARSRGRSAREPSRRNIGRLPDHLERIERVIEPESLECPCGCGEMVRIGEDRTERLDCVPAQLRVIVTVRPKYACRTCAQGVMQAPAPAHLIEGGLPTEALIAQLLVSKYGDHLPLYRQAQIFARSGVLLDRSTLAGWAGAAGYHLAPLTRRLSEILKASSHLFMDETRCPVLDPGQGRTKSGYLWALAREERGWGGTGPPGVVYFYADGRGGKHAEAFLGGFTGTLQVDAYAGYKRLARKGRPEGALVLANCWAHARRKLVEIQKSSGSPIADEGLKQIAALYAIETEIRGLDPEARRLVRQDRTAPLVAAFGDWLKQKRARISAKSRLGEHLTYIANCWGGLQVFLSDGHVEMDSNPVENRIRPLALGRKNHLFAGHDEGAHAWACIASLIETCKLNGVEPLGYLTKTLEAIAQGHPMSRLDELLPGPFACAS